MLNKKDFFTNLKEIKENIKKKLSGYNETKALKSNENESFELNDNSTNQGFVRKLNQNNKNTDENSSKKLQSKNEDFPEKSNSGNIRNFQDKDHYKK
jgi:hypothetical protein